MNTDINRHGDHPYAQIGSRWTVNDSGLAFTIVRFEAQYAVVVNRRGTERHILSKRIYPSQNRTGYTMRALAAKPREETAS